MIAVDTNVLIRFFVRDDAKQAALASEFIRQAKKRDEKVLIDLVVLCELVWVLESGYGYSKVEIVSLLERILSTKQFEVQNSGIVWQAVDDFRTKSGDFADCIIGRININEGSRLTATFDRTLKAFPFFEIL